MADRPWSRPRRLTGAIAARRAVECVAADLAVERHVRRPRGVLGVFHRLGADGRGPRELAPLARVDTALVAPPAPEGDTGGDRDPALNSHARAISARALRPIAADGVARSASEYSAPDGPTPWSGSAGLFPSGYASVLRARRWLDGAASAGVAIAVSKKLSAAGFPPALALATWDANGRLAPIGQTGALSGAAPPESSGFSAQFGFRRGSC